jgi:hypothetical protein
MSEKEQQLSSFCHGVQHPQVSGFEVLELLDTRSTLAGWEGELNAEARKELEAADRLFLKNAAQFYENIV